MLGDERFPVIFIRAPWIERTGPGVEVLGTVNGHAVFARQGKVMVTSFHPKLNSDMRVYAYFFRMMSP